MRKVEKKGMKNKKKACFMSMTMFLQAVAYFESALRCAPFFINRYNAGIIASATPGSSELPPPIPRLLKYARPNNGKAAAILERKNAFPASTLAAYRW